jgi:hypothetical protein
MLPLFFVPPLIAGYFRQLTPMSAIQFSLFSVAMPPLHAILPLLAFILSSPAHSPHYSPPREIEAEASSSSLFRHDFQLSDSQRLAPRHVTRACRAPCHYCCTRRGAAARSAFAAATLKEESPDADAIPLRRRHDFLLQTESGAIFRCPTSSRDLYSCQRLRAFIPRPFDAATSLYAAMPMLR